jgi:hypothetical protein
MDNSMNKEAYKKEIVCLDIKYLDMEGNVEIGQIEVNKLIKDKTIGVFNDLFNIGFNIHKIAKANSREDRDIILLNETTGWNWRYVLGTEVLSKHSFGMAIDLNPRINPAIPSKMQEIYILGETKGVIDEKVVNIFKKWGFSWGGEIFNKFWDSHHFEVIL